MANVDNENLIFISYATPDRELVSRYADALEKMGFSIWMDYRKILPGQNWDLEIKRGLSRASIIVLFLSKNSVDRRGYLQREINIALKQREERLIDDIYLIPVILDDDIVVPNQLVDLQFLKISEGNTEERLHKALTYQFERLGVRTESAQESTEVRWSQTTISETKDGLPGYEVEIRYLNFRSDKYPGISEVGQVLRGELIPHLFEQRMAYFEPDATHYNFGQEKFRRTNTVDASCADPVFKGKAMSIACSVHWYSAGAAHPNHGYQTFNFAIDPVFRVSSVEWLFEEQDDALATIQNLVREKLLTPQGDEEAGGEWTLDEGWVIQGTSEWSDFENFILTEHDVEFLFSAYAVGPYAAGPQSVTVPYKNLVAFMKPAVKSMLELEYL